MDRDSHWIRHLLDIKAVSNEGLDIALKEQEKTGRRLDEILVSNNLIDRKKLTKSVFGIYSRKKNRGNTGRGRDTLAVASE